MDGKMSKFLFSLLWFERMEKRENKHFVFIPIEWIFHLISVIKGIERWEFIASSLLSSVSSFINCKNIESYLISILILFLSVFLLERVERRKAGGIDIEPFSKTIISLILTFSTRKEQQNKVVFIWNAICFDWRTFNNDIWRVGEEGGKIE